MVVIVVRNAQDAQSFAAAEQRTPVRVTRIYTGLDGQTHAEQLT
jgi:hypothetical protein